VYQHGKTVRGSLTSLKYAPNPKRSEYRLAVVVSKKVSKSAVVRNRIRRRLYEAFRRQEGAFTGVHDMIVTVFSEQVATMPAEDVEKLVVRHLQDAGITKQ
jgi:ribonuclease P protein component